MFGKLSTTTAVAAVIATFGLISSAQADPLWEITDPDDDSTFKCLTAGDTVFWMDAESGPQNGTDSRLRIWADTPTKDFLQRRMRVDSDYDQTSGSATEDRAINSCGKVRIDWLANDYTEFLGFASCKYTIRRSGEEDYKVRVGNQANPDSLIGVGHGNPAADPATDTFQVPFFSLANQNSQRMTIEAFRRHTGDGFFDFSNSGSPAIKLDCEGELVMTMAGGGGGDGFGESSKGKSWKYHTTGSLGSDRGANAWGYWRVDYRDTVVDYSNGEQDFSCYWSPDHLLWLYDDPDALELVGSYYCDDIESNSGDGSLVIKSMVPGKGKNKIRGSVHVTEAENEHLLLWMTLETGNIKVMHAE